MHVVEWHLPLLAITDHPGQRRGQRQQLADGGAGAVPGPQLEHLTEEHERDDHGGRLKIERCAAVVPELVRDGIGKHE